MKISEMLLRKGVHSGEIDIKHENGLVLYHDPAINKFKNRLTGHVCELTTDMITTNQWDVAVHKEYTFKRIELITAYATAWTRCYKDNLNPRDYLLKYLLDELKMEY